MNQNDKMLLEALEIALDDLTAKYETPTLPLSGFVIKQDIEYIKQVIKKAKGA